ncbi:MAG: hypothetical protein IT520_07815 [Burkholderiales bacterium]|nr:hypothetical protein [Burkholderiales bacterium]
MPLFDAYRSEACACRTVNEFNRLHIDYEAWLSPSEFEELARGIHACAPTMPPASMIWARGLGELIARSGNPVRAWDRRPVYQDAVWYAPGDGAPPRRERTLVVCYTDFFGRLFMPIPAYLQHCPAPGHDYLVLRDRSRRYFVEGLADVAPTLTSALRAVLGAIDAHKFRRIQSVGASSGGFAALWSAVEFGFSSGVSLGGAAPSTLERSGLSADGFREALRAHPVPPLAYYYSADYPTDRANAAELAALMPVVTVPIAGASKHNLVFEIYQRGELVEFLAGVHAIPPRATRYAAPDAAT